MRKTLSALVISLALAGPISAGDKKDEPFVYSPPKYSQKEKPVYLSCFEDACKIKYQKDEGHDQGQDNWQTPEETIRKGTGDCEDMAILLYRNLKREGLKPRIVSGFGNIHELEPHVWVEYDHPTQGTLIPDPSIRKIILKSEIEKQEPRYLYIKICDESKKVDKMLE